MGDRARQQRKQRSSKACWHEAQPGAALFRLLPALNNLLLSFVSTLVKITLPTSGTGRLAAGAVVADQLQALCNPRSSRVCGGTLAHIILAK